MVIHPTLLRGWRVEWTFFAVILSSQMAKRDGHGKTFLSLLDPGSATISIEPALPLEEVGQASILSRLRRKRRWPLLYFLLKGGYGIVPVDQYSWLNNAPGICLCLNVLFFIQFIFNMFYDSFLWSVRNYGKRCLFDILFCSLDYYYLYYVYIVILFYSILYCSFNILFWSSYYCFLARVAIYNLFFKFDQYVEEQIFL